MSLTTLRTGIDPVRFFSPNWLVATSIRINSSGDGFAIAHIPLTVYSGTIETTVTRDLLKDVWFETTVTRELLKDILLPA